MKTNRIQGVGRREFLAGSLAFCGCLMSRPARAVLAGAEEAAKPLPDYYNAHLDAVAAKVNALAERTADGFWFITDLHITANRRQSGKALAALTARVPSIRKTLCGGDLPEAFSQRFESSKAGVDYAIDYYRLFWVEPIEASGQLVYSAKGNHDFTIRYDAKTDDGFTYSETEARKVVMGSKGCRGAVTNPDDPTACYYYFDNAAAKVRYVVADTTDSVDPGKKFWAVVGGMRETQLKWLAEKAVSTLPDGWGAVVMHHLPLTGCVGYDEERALYAPFRTLLEAYQNRGTCTVCGKTYDFAAAKGRILMDITGHHHAERQTFQNGILHVTEPCDAGYRDYILGSKPWCGDLPDKARGTVNEQTFDAVQLDPAHDRIHFTRVGGGQDRVIHLKPLVARIGEPLQVEAPLLKGPLTWGCYDADRIARTPNPKNRYNPFITYFNETGTIDSQGRFTGKKPGEALVVAMDAKLDKEIFPVTIR